MQAQAIKSIQMNVRVNQELKSDGDAVLSELNMTPSEAVRLLYEFIIKNRNNLNKVKETFGIDGANTDSKKHKKYLIKKANEGRQIYSDLLEKYKLDSLHIGTDEEEINLDGLKEEHMKEQFGDLYE